MNSKTFRVIASLVAFGCLLRSDGVPPIACNLKALTSDERKQLTAVGGHVISAITVSRELNDGYSFRVDSARASLTDVAKWLDLWRRCCPFYEFRIDFHEDRV
jgi:hypothetical protein